jgi:hypothetical protein
MVPAAARRVPRMAVFWTSSASLVAALAGSVVIVGVGGVLVSAGEEERSEERSGLPVSGVSEGRVVT